MSPKFVSSLFVAVAIFAGCSEPEEPYADSIPNIPPGRAAEQNGDGASHVLPQNPNEGK